MRRLLFPLIIMSLLVSGALGATGAITTKSYIQKTFRLPETARLFQPGAGGLFTYDKNHFFLNSGYPGPARTMSSLKPAEKMALEALAKRNGAATREATGFTFGRQYSDGYELNGGGARIQIKPVGTVEGALEAGLLVYKNIDRRMDVAFVPTPGGVEELFLIRSKGEGWETIERKITVGNGVDIKINSRGELEAGSFVLSVPQISDAKGQKVTGRYELKNKTRTGPETAALLVLSFDAAGLTYPILIDPVWLPTGDMSVTRGSYTGTVANLIQLPNGKVLVTEGHIFHDQSCELFNPATGTWSAGGSLNYQGNGRSLYLLPDGKVLCLGSINPPYMGGPQFAAEKYDPATNSWAVAGTFGDPANYWLSGLTALLNDGRVLIANSTRTDTTNYVVCFIYDPTAETYALAGSTFRGSYATLTTLPNGQVLAAGGQEGMVWDNRCELYTPWTGVWSYTGNLNTARTYYTATLLSDGKVLVAGGANLVIDGGSSYIGYLDSSELFLNGAWSSAGHLNTARGYHTATLLPDGQVLVAGGASVPVPYGSTVYYNSCELWDPISGNWSTAANLNTARGFHAATLLNNGQVLVVGGTNTTEGNLRSAELYGVPPTYLLTSEADPHLTITPSGTTTESQGNSRSYTIAADPGYAISDVLVDGVSVGAVGNYTFSNISADHLIHADESFLGYVITSDTDLHGTITPSGTRIVTPGGSQSYAISAEAGYHISDVLVDGGSVGAVNNYTFSNVLAGHTIHVSIEGTVTWQPPGTTMVAGHYWHASTQLLNGKVLVAGGNPNDMAMCELFDPATRTWSATGSLHYGRTIFNAPLLDNGKVLAVGGGPPELYDPDTGTWSLTGASYIATAEYWSAVAKLANGKVLLAGGQTQDYPYFYSTCELYDPASGTWNPTGSMSRVRSLHTLTLLPNGKVLVTGGQSYGTANSCELYDPATGAWSFTGSMAYGRAGHTATMLPNGKVLVAGGASPTCEVYDPATGRWSLTGSMSTTRTYYNGTCAALHNGLVLIMAGDSTNAACEAYNPVTGLWTGAGIFSLPRWYFATTLLRDGTVMATGGQTSHGVTNTWEWFGASPPSHGQTFEVTNTNDSGDGSLRQCILYANANPGSDDIFFNIPSDQATGAPGAYRWLITPPTALPPLTESVRILGSTQPTDSTYRNLYGPVIEVRGPGAPQWTGDIRGIDIAAPFCEIEGLTINGFSEGIVLSGVLTTNCQIYNNYLGTNYLGGTAPGNYYNGVKIDGGASDNVIGLAGAKNVISGNSFGITISGANGNQINANYIGTDSTGTASLGNTNDGIQLRSGAYYNRIGDGTDSGRNVISGNGACGIIAAESSAGTVILGNYIGCNAAGTGALGNGDSGIWLSSTECTARIGGSTAGQGNVISGNANAGVYLSSSNNLVQGNYIGCDRTGGTALPNGWAGIGLDGGNYNQIGGNVLSGNDADGLNLYNSSSNEVFANLIGCSASGGLMIHGGNSGDGIVLDQSNYNRIGDGTSGGLNVISGNTYVGVFLTSGSTGNTLRGNSIGCGSDGTSPLANSTGVELADSPANTIAGNLISGNSSAGLWLTGAANANSILSNYIGCDVTGNVPLPNGTVPTDAGILINENSSYNRIGDGTAQGGNLIFGNEGNGVLIDGAGSGSDHNLISRNSFHDNNGWGIALWDGANEYMPAPTIEAAYLSGVLGRALANATVEVFATGAPDPSGAGEGLTYLGSVRAGGDGSWLLVLPLTRGTTITATATNQNGSTSQFSLNLTVEGSPSGLTFVVTNCADSGPGSLRQAILNANDHFGRDTISFSIPTSESGYQTASWGSYWRITPASVLPELTDGVAILGSTQVANQGDWNEHRPEIELRGGGGVTYGLKLNGALPSSLASNSTIEGLVINNFTSFGLQLHGDSSNKIGGCNIHDNYLGTDPSGTSSVSNGLGLYLEYGTGNRIANNLVSGNWNYGLYLNYGTSNEVFGNYIGCDASGESVPAGNHAGSMGILVYGDSNIIGGNASGEGNLISGNSYGLYFSGGSYNRVAGNFIGTDKSGLNPLANNVGLYLNGSAFSLIGPGNVIAYSNSNGVALVSGVSNTITQNAIFQNQGLEISLNNGANADIQPPTILNAFLDRVSGEAADYATVEVFAVGVPNHTGYGGGRTYLGSAQADGSGLWSYSFETTVATLTATATDRSGNTSQFSANITSSAEPFTVTNTHDSGPNSLRQVILDVNAALDAHTILFNIRRSDPGYTTEAGVSFWRIKPASALPVISHEGTVIDGWSQANFIGTDTNPYGPEIEIDGTSAGTYAIGFETDLSANPSNCTIEGLAINNFHDGIYFWGGSGHSVLGCYIGTDVTGTILRGSGSSGIALAGNHDGSPIHDCLIGDGTDAGRNVISGNSYGVFFGSAASSNEVRGNYIGTNASGTAALPNTFGIYFLSIEKYNRIIDNVISGNSNIGISTGGFSSSTEVLGNYFGTDATGLNPLPNLNLNIEDSGFDNRFGDGTISGRNVIAASGDLGILLGYHARVTGNYIGTNKNGEVVAGMGNRIGIMPMGSGAMIGPDNKIAGNTDCGILVPDWTPSFPAVTNETISRNYIGYNGVGIRIGSGGNFIQISQNTMEANTGLGISLEAGSNNDIQPPVITGEVVEVDQVTLYGTSDAYAVIELFKADSHPDPDGGEGKVFLGSTEANGAGDWSKTVPRPTPGSRLTATATLFDGSGGYTSQFARNVFIGDKYVVYNTDDSGSGSLRQCLFDANADPGRQTITFAIPDDQATLASGYAYWRIAPATPLPAITESVALLASTQPTSDAYNNPFGPEVELRGPGDGSFDGLLLQAANCTIEGLVINNGFTNGLFLSGAEVDHNNIYGNYIGTDVTGEAAVGNFTNGLFLANGANYNLIRGNLISGNDANGISIYNSGTSHNQISGNIIGLNRAGTAAVSNMTGLFMYDDARDNIIGGATTSEGNIISGNVLYGLDIESVYGSNQITGNYIGTDQAGIAAQGNNTGVYLWDVSVLTIGNGTTAGRNVISGNGLCGLQVDASNTTWILGNYIGTSANGVSSLANGSDAETGDLPGGGLLLTNSTQVVVGDSGGGRNIISGNSYCGLDISASSGCTIEGNYIGVDLNQSPRGNHSARNPSGGIFLDVDSDHNTIGPNNVISDNDRYGVVVLGSAHGNTITRNSWYDNNDLGIKLNGGGNNGVRPPVINTTLYNPVSFLVDVVGTSEANATIEVFATGVPDPSGSGEGRTYLGATLADGGGNWTFPYNFTRVTTISATATDPGGNTSEFARNRLAAKVTDPFTVTTTADAGDGSLRQCLLNANATTEMATITFSIPTAEATLASGYAYWQIAPASALPALTHEGVVIDGTTQPTDGTYNNPYGPVIVLYGASAGGYGLNVQANYCTIEGLVINGCTFGLYLSGSHSSVLGNYLGSDATGSSAQANSCGLLIANSSYNRIGSTSPGNRNLISGNSGYGIQLQQGSNSNEVLSNFVGCQIDGVSPLPNTMGIVISDGSSNNMVGNGRADGRNVISGNSQSGVDFASAECRRNEIKGNYIGCDYLGTSPLPNGNHGIYFEDESGSSNIVGPNNIIAYNGTSSSHYGVLVEGALSAAETITQNSLHDNYGLGINLAGGANNWIPAPTIEVATIASISGQAIPNATVEVFTTGDPDPTGSGEGRAFLGSTEANGSGNWELTLVSTLTAGTTLSATATDTQGNTSAFAWNVAAIVPTYLITSEAGLNTTLTPSGETAVTYGNSQRYLISAEAGYYVADVSVDGLSIGATSEYTFTNVTAHHRISSEASELPAAVELIISRETDSVGSDILVGWTTSPTPDVYVLTGDGSGVYTNEATRWTRVTNPVVAGFTLSGRVLHHTGQVGAGTGEAYYKALLAGRVKDSALPTAEAVGKFNVALGTGLSNLAALPLIQRNPGVNAVIGDQLPVGTKLSSRDPSGRWDEVLYNGGGFWSTNLSLEADRGFWLNVSSGTPTMTLVGSVFNGTERTITVYNGLNNLLGSAYPVKSDLNDSQLGSALSGSGGSLHAFESGVWYEPIYNGSTWSSLAYKLKPGKGFWVIRNSSGTSVWYYPKLY